ncbi:MAG: hypothetical protein ACLUD0_20400 [Eubacterium ramulus]
MAARGEKTASKTLNRAAEVTRQPGSTFKILTCLRTGIWTVEHIRWQQTVLDEPITYSSGQTIHNADGKYRGYTQHPGSNSGFCQRSGGQDSGRYYTAKAGYEMAKKFGISTLTKDDIVESLATWCRSATAIWSWQQLLKLFRIRRKI